MTFNSFEFAALFFIVIALCAVCPGSRIAILLIGSFVFYSWISWKFGLILFAMSVVGYFAPAMLALPKGRASRILVFVVCIIAILMPLLILKYWNFAVATIWQMSLIISPRIRSQGFCLLLFTLAGGGCFLVLLLAKTKQGRIRRIVVRSLVPAALVTPLIVIRWEVIAGAIKSIIVLHNSPLPPGISFHTFQLLSYVIDVFRKRAPVEGRPRIFFLFSSFFPQLVAGPIERANHLIPQLPSAGVLSKKNSSIAFQLFLHGLFLKIAIADPVGALVDHIYSDIAIRNGSELFAGTALFYVQIYCDFAGYSLMALGVARALGVVLVQNFNAPMLATSPVGFWHRWHISLSQWFRDYVYIPLGGSERGIPRWVGAVLITFLLSGFWHGANWTFVAWGAVHGLALIMSVVIARGLSAVPSTFISTFVAWLLTQVFVVLSWVFFRAISISQALDVIRAISDDFLLSGCGWWDLVMLPTKFGISWLIVVLGALVLTWIVLLDRATFRSADAYPYRGRWQGRVQQAIMIASIALALTFGSTGSRAFIYFQF